MTQAEIEHPMITGGGRVQCTYSIGAYKTILEKDPESFGPIKYHFVLTVFGPDGKQPVLFVTSEQNELQKELMAIAQAKNPDQDIEYNPNDYFLGVFSKGGRKNLGASEDWGDVDKFEVMAIAIAKRELNITGELKIISLTKDENEDELLTPPSAAHSHNKSNNDSKIANAIAFVGFIICAGVLFKFVDTVGDWFQGNPWYVNTGIFISIGWIGTQLTKAFTSTK